MPAPYDAQTAVEIEPERLALLPGNELGSAFPPDLSGPFARNERLRAAKKLFVGQVFGSESVAVTPGGDLLMLDKFGFLHRAKPRGAPGSSDFELSQERPLYIGPGRPLGFHIVEEGAALLVCDSLKGLVRVDLATGTISILANRVTATGLPFHYANDLDVAADGTVYFTSSTAGTVALHPDGYYDTLRSYLLNLLSGDATGQLLSFDPVTREVRSLLGGIYYANGVAVSADGSFVAVVETNLCRVLRYWLTGPNKGSRDVLIDRLPGMPDGISRSAAGGFWIALVVPLSPLPRLLGPHRWLRQLASHIMVPLVPYLSKRWGCVIRIDSNGYPMESLMDPTGEHLSSVSAVTETADGMLFLGNLQGDFVSVLEL
ncbi:unnamed protein product [Polarella glacialis]|uniref:Strictosidine synthase conserved region domain-containing protein n=1 Tax=Polarella glacialis TaxID=89957 RepID=A0A813G0Y0_POLGL|nr:unnamed protein product [Polarella glacialis]